MLVVINLLTFFCFFIVIFLQLKAVLKANKWESCNLYCSKHTLPDINDLGEAQFSTEHVSYKKARIKKEHLSILSSMHTSIQHYLTTPGCASVWSSLLSTCSPSLLSLHTLVLSFFFAAVHHFLWA